MVGLCLIMVAIGFTMLLVGITIDDDKGEILVLFGALLFIIFMIILGINLESNKTDEHSNGSNSSSCCSTVSKHDSKSDKILQIAENNKVIITYSICSYKQDDKTVTIIKANGVEETIILNNDSKVNIYDVK